jgi:hypothetical protein
MGVVCIWLVISLVAVMNSVGYAEDRGLSTDLQQEATTNVISIMNQMPKEKMIRYFITICDLTLQAQDVKTELETYMFYFHRYESHRNAGVRFYNIWLKLIQAIADKQKKSCVKKENQILEKFDVRSQDTKFLMEATEQLISNRRVLQYSYVMGYYLDKSKVAEKNLFEYLQEDLEKHTNQLRYSLGWSKLIVISTVYEQNLDTFETYQQFMKWKEEVTNYTRVTKKVNKTKFVCNSGSFWRTLLREPQKVLPMSINVNILWCCIVCAFEHCWRNKHRN